MVSQFGFGFHCKDEETKSFYSENCVKTSICESKKSTFQEKNEARVFLSNQQWPGTFMSQKQSSLKTHMNKYVLQKIEKIHSTHLINSNGRLLPLKVSKIKIRGEKPRRHNNSYHYLSMDRLKKKKS